MNKYGIIKRVNEIKTYLHTNDPFQIAEYFGIKITYRSHTEHDRKAYIMKMPGYPTVISISDGYTKLSQKVLCAHELGHALLHEGYNTFGINSSNIKTDVEYEANLFAVALLFNKLDFNTDICKLDSYTLKTIMDLNIHRK